MPDIFGTHSKIIVIEYGENSKNPTLRQIGEHLSRLLRKVIGQ